MSRSVCSTGRRSASMAAAGIEPLQPSRGGSRPPHPPRSSPVIRLRRGRIVERARRRALLSLSTWPSATSESVGLSAVNFFLVERLLRARPLTSLPVLPFILVSAHAVGFNDRCSPLAST